MKRKKSTKRVSKKIGNKDLRREIIKILKRNPSVALPAKVISKKLSVKKNTEKIKPILDELVASNVIIETGKFIYQYKDTEGLGDRKSAIGKVDMTRRGAAFILTDELEDDVFISEHKLYGAFHGDTVEIQYWPTRRGKRPEGQVIKVVKRANTQFIGIVKISEKFAFFIPSNERVSSDMFVALKHLNGAKDNDIVVVEVIDWKEGTSKSPEAKVLSVMGQTGNSDLEMKTILINNGFNLEFPGQVLQEANKLSDEITAQDMAERRDMRSVTTFTIDPHDAKDFDDALSYQVLENGHKEIGVHIADVAHYIEEGSALDKEAFERSTSVYLVDRVLPMLPERLSNGLCSLRPKEDKFTFSAVFEFDEQDKIVSRWFGRTLTHSDRRFTYEEAQEVIETKTGDFAAEILEMDRISKVLRKRKFKNGAINFETDEVRFKLDEEAKPIGVYLKVRKDAHMLIEDFMLLANREVAWYISEKGKEKEIPFVYRVHDEPDPDKIASLKTFAMELGFDINIESPKSIAHSFNSMRTKAEENEALKMLTPIAIRTMAKAVYTSDNIGHYGLAFTHYTHFTSPIRRYSDVLVHRLLHKNLEDQVHRTDKEALELRCKHISEMERKAMDSERESVRYKQVEYLEQHIGEEFTGKISGIIDRGLFVELDGNKCEGMVEFFRIPEPFDIPESRLKAVGITTGKVFKMGQNVKVKVIDADKEKRQVSFELLDEYSFEDFDNLN